MKDKAHRPFSNKLALSLSLTISIMFSFIMLLGTLYSHNKEMLRDLGQADIINGITHFFQNVIVSYSLFMLNFWIIETKWKSRTKILAVIFGLLVIVLILSPIFSKCQILLMDNNDIFFNYYMGMNLVKNLIILIIVILSTNLIYTWNQRQKTMLENQKLIIENMRNRYEALKNQVDPHFLFNSLNTLDGLVGFDNDRAHEYVQQLSFMLRYVIQNKDVISLKYEFDFTMSYIYLMKIRYKGNLKIICNVDDKYYPCFIMPISLQLLVENAIKHNVISDKHRLTISIVTTLNNTIKVENNICSKIYVEGSSGGIGLANLVERYKLLFQKDVIIYKTEEIFCVEIPLIEKKRW